MARRPCYELVHGKGGWFVRIIAANGKETWRTSETYQRRNGALQAIKGLERLPEDTRVHEVDERA